MRETELGRVFRLRVSPVAKLFFIWVIGQGGETRATSTFDISLSIGVSETSVKRAVRELVENSVITVSRSRRMQPAVYKLRGSHG